MVPVLLQPKSRGRISLKSSNPYHWPRMEPNFYTEPSDMTNLIEGIRIVRPETNYNKRTSNSNKFQTLLDIKNCKCE